MISEEAEPSSSSIAYPQTYISHLDKSHLCIHTYPDDSPQDNIAIFRADIELSTCGVISPLTVINYVIEAFNADVIDIDYRVRGMTRNKQGQKLYNIDSISQLSECLSADIVTKFSFTEHASIQRNLFHTRLARKQIVLDHHLFGMTQNDLAEQQQVNIQNLITTEIEQLFTNNN
jgi:S-adenosylmethionine decarboxylase